MSHDSVSNNEVGFVWIEKTCLFANNEKRVHAYRGFACVIIVLRLFILSAEQAFIQMLDQTQTNP